MAAVIRYCGVENRKGTREHVYAASGIPDAVLRVGDGVSVVKGPEGNRKVWVPDGLKATFDKEVGKYNGHGKKSVKEPPTAHLSNEMPVDEVPRRYSVYDHPRRFGRAPIGNFENNGAFGDDSEE